MARANVRQHSNFLEALGVFGLRLGFRPGALGVGFLGSGVSESGELAPAF